MENSLARGLSIAEAKVQYDTQVKRVLSEKVILAWILKYVTEEFAKMPIEEIQNCIEGEPEISTVRVQAGKTNKKPRITGNSNEDKVEGEGEIYYDIRFFALVPQKEKPIKLIINVEAQKDFYPGYEIITRGVYYGSRLISAQGDTEFKNSEYDELKKVYSIWICMNAPQYIGNAISGYFIKKEDFVMGIPDKRSAYDKLSVILICLNEKKEKGIILLRMLNTLLSAEKSVENKKKELKEEFGIEMEEQGKELEGMCNLSEWVWEQGIEQGVEQGRKNIVEKMFRKGMLAEEIAALIEEPVKLIEEIILELQG